MQNDLFITQLPTSSDGSDSSLKTLNLAIRLMAALDLVKNAGFTGLVDPDELFRLEADTHKDGLDDAFLAIRRCTAVIATLAAAKRAGQHIPFRR